MTASSSLILQSLAVTLHSAVSALAAPSTSSDGADITSARRGSMSPRDAVLTIDATGTFDMTDVYLCGYDSTDGKWRKIADINNADAISLTANVGFAQKVFDVMAFERLALVGTFTGTCTVKVKPLENLN